MKDHDIAREIVQDAFANLWEKRETIELDRSPQAYMATTVRNRCLNYLRDHKKYDRSIIEFEGLGNDHDYKDHDQLVTSEIRLRIEEATSSLPEKCRQVFLMNRMENKKYQEIATELNLSVKTVEAQMSKALKVMREKLAEFMSILLIIIEILKNQ